MLLFKKFHHLGSLALWLIFLFISVIIFGSSLNNFFVSDDFHWLTIARDTSLSWQIFLTNYTGDHLGGSYNPLLVLIFKTSYNIFHNNYFGYHLISIILHATNSFLVYKLAKQIFKLADFNKPKKLAILSSFLFVAYPIHVEVVSWIAAWPHLWAIFFYLLSLINYFGFRATSSIKKLVYSLLFFVLALLTKEIAISLPLVILIWEIYWYSIKMKTSIKSYYLIAYFVLLALFLWLRYFSIGLIFGYYASSSLNFAYLDWIANLAIFFGDLFSFGFLRTIIYKAIYHYADLVVIIILASLAFYLSFVLKKKKYLQASSLISLLFVLAPVLVTGLHRTSFGGERYLYLPSIFFILWLLILLRDINVNFKINRYIFILLCVLFLTINAHKLSIWDSASGLSHQIVDSYQNLGIKNNQKLLSVALPDNLEGAEVFRNNLEQALEIYYPDNHPDIITTFAYTEVSKENKNKQLLKWREDERGWFAESIDGSFVVTGITSINKDNVYWELWNYNYQNYKANVIRLLPEAKILEQIKKDELEILIFDKGVLKILD
jgi:protein O-mannosyl-transferase